MQKVCYNTLGDYMDRTNIDKIAQTPEDRLLLAKLWDKLNSGMRKNILTSTAFLSPRELQLAGFLFGNSVLSFGGYDDAERKMLIYLPDYLTEDDLMADDSPVACMHATFYKTDTPSHRDFLGALIGSGISRDAIGDILVGDGYCDFLVTRSMVPWLLENFQNAGRTALKLSCIPLSQLTVPQQSFEEFSDTVASTRLDCVLASGFRISRSVATDYILQGKAYVDALVCEKPDRIVAEGAKLSIRGLGKIQLAHVGGTSKKGRIFLTIRRYQ